MISRNTIIALTGLRATGKTTVADDIYNLLNAKNLIDNMGDPYKVERLNIKDTFTKYANYITMDLFGYDVNTVPKEKIPQFKNLQRAISVWAEEEENTVWSNKWAEMADPNSLLIMDDCRTSHNVEMLRKLGVSRPIIIIKLEASKEERKKRLTKSFGSKKADELLSITDYTEQELLPDSGPSNIEWKTLNTEYYYSDSIREILEGKA